MEMDEDPNWVPPGLDSLTERRRLRSRIEMWIFRKNTTLFGRSFEVQSSEGLREAADWLTDIVMKVSNREAYRVSLLTALAAAGEYRKTLIKIANQRPSQHSEAHNKATKMAKLALAKYDHSEIIRGVRDAIASEQVAT